MKIKRFDAQNKRNIEIIFDEKVSVKQVADYLTTLYREASHDGSIQAADITGYLRHRLDLQPGEEKDYAVVDDSSRCGLFTLGGNMKFLQQDYWVMSYHAKPEETETLVSALEKACS